MSRYLQEALFVDYFNYGLYRRRSTSIEPLFGYVKDSLQVLHQHGVPQADAEIVGAMAAYNLIVYLNWGEKQPLRAVKAFVDLL